ncbi:amidase [Sodalis ligni]|uniref:amidase n=1 Tax=Sodalis ligni TaxID=2697027 RepID=UPI00193FC54B|nr:amidase [Sodalis ligni]QWA12957.1 amidase [Sodalis ligni]
MAEELLQLGSAEQAELIRQRKISPVDLVESSFRCIERWDPVLHAWITTDRERALEKARQAEKEIAGGLYRGPLHGLPFGVKDQMHALGFPTTLGTRVLNEDETVAPCNAAVIEKLTEAGAILIGKQNLHEFGKGGTINFAYGEPRNPWNPDYSASSSSTGSGIAAAAGMCSFSIGEDTGGSIRGPAAFNGVVGLRPTFGRVSRFGAVMEGYTTDVLGPICRRVADAAQIMTAISGYDARDNLSSRHSDLDFMPEPGKSLKGLKLGIVREIAYNDSTSDEVSAAFETSIELLRQLGADVTVISLPLTLFAVPLILLSLDADVAAWFVSKYLRDRYDRFDTGTRTRLAAASLIPATVYNRAMRGRFLARRQLLDAFNQVDILVCPTVPTAPKPIDQMQERLDTGDDAVRRLMERRIGLYPFSLANVPAISLPMGFSRQGLPLALQFAGRPFDEKTVLQVADSYERAAGWHAVKPDLAKTVAGFMAQENQ